MYLKPNFSKTQIIDKDSGRVPVYLQLSQIIKQKISNGEFPPGSKIPSEASIGKHYGLSTMTVRQAIGVVADQGLLRRIQGSGTYVTTPAWTQASFTWDGLMELLEDKKNSTLTILKAGMVEASPRIAETLNINLGSRVIHLIRLVSHKGHPFLLNQAILKFDPLAPIVEAEMELSSLSGIFSGEGSHYVKKAFLRVEPYALNATESLQLKSKENETAFRINYTFYNYKDLPLGSGWFLTPKKYIALSAKIGLWD